MAGRSRGGVIRDLDAANRALEELAGLAARVALIETSAREEVRRILARSEAAAAPLSRSMARIEAGLEAFLRGRGTGAVPLLLPAGAAGLCVEERLLPRLGLTWAGVAEAARVSGRYGVLERVERVRPESLAALQPEVLAGLGVERVTRSVFWCRPGAQG